VDLTPFFFKFTSENHLQKVDYVSVNLPPKNKICMSEAHIFFVQKDNFY
jgi:hypothetical protein